MKKRLKGGVRLFAVIVAAVLGTVTIHYACRILLTDSFVIPGSSMSPTLNKGDRVSVCKPLFGPRIYTGFRFTRGEPLHSIRLPGLRKIRPDDVIVFNYPFGYDDWSRIEFRINYVYCKRVLGCPGDKVGITDGRCWNGRMPGPIGVAENQEKLRASRDSIASAGYLFNAIPLPLSEWNILDMGPLTVPAKNLTVQMTAFNAELYRLVIEYETGLKLAVSDDGITLSDGTAIREYTFRQNWYFVLGDNSTDSRDSRYFGFVPEPFIIGIVTHVRH